MGQSERERAAITLCLDALARRGITTKAEVARRLAGAHGRAGTLKTLSHHGGVTPEFMRDLATAAGLSVTEVFGALGWLPQRELRDTAFTDLAHDATSALRALSEVPDLTAFTAAVPAAPFAAARALLTDPDGQERFEVRLSQIVSGDRYRAGTSAVAEFGLRDRADPLPSRDLERLVLAAGFPHPPRVADAHAAVRWELRARTAAALSDGQEYSWQGDRAHRTWRAAAGTWPAHLLVQDSIVGQQRPVDPHPLGGGDAPGTIVVVGGRESGGQAAALLAEALGWQFVLVRPDIDITPGGRVRRYPKTRAQAWIGVAEHIARRAADGRPWHTVVLLRPDALTHDGAGTHSYAAELLERTPAPILYLRPPTANLHWWVARNAGNHDPGDFPEDVWLDRYTAAYAAVEDLLLRRSRHDDLLLRCPEPARPLLPHVPEAPDEVMDQAARAAWTAARWLTGSGVELRAPRPGVFARWRPALATDPVAFLPRL
ncbi:hypothetical protein EDD29_8543 [Actinocorallia herbida]|uniref:Uncharacterized protein n=1 Tax=Actinocorallia herbida TaxID=58109 RepID=A0A3N1DB98_9ACTN|nr:hypothetical protein [Actinocorallia herbida]ROO90804.1 hypothetical protein EDD29_8543 [Actinocorallia herbida]